MFGVPNVMVTQVPRRSRILLKSAGRRDTFGFENRQPNRLERPEDTANWESGQISSCCARETLLMSDAGEKRVPIELLLTDGGGACFKEDAEQANWNTASLDALMEHIVARHHGFLRKELPSMERAIAKAVELRGGPNPTALVSLERTFRFFKRELELHLRKEEEVLFPLIRRLEVAVTTGARLPQFPFGSIANPIGIMEEDHDTEIRQLEKMLGLTGNYSGPQEAVIICRLVFERLQSIDADMRLHVRLENDILFPRISSLEDAGSATRFGGDR
jgi:regulator of cell morphogenesis and NO signaling